MGSVNLYDNVYGDFASDAESAVRREAYGEDLGQSSWLTAQPSGSASPTCWGSAPGARCWRWAAARADRRSIWRSERGCRVTGVDINEHGVRNARALAQSRGVADRARFEVVDARGALPFPAGRFDAIVSNDAMCHIAGRAGVLARLAPDAQARRPHPLHRCDGGDRTRHPRGGRRPGARSATTCSSARASTRRCCARPGSRSWRCRT